MMEVEVSQCKPVDFQPKMQASACYLEVEGRLLLIQQGIGQTDEGLWGVPAGKLEQGETPEMAAERELLEETGIPLASLAHMIHLGTLYVRRPDLDYVYDMFKIHLDQKPSIQLSAEHHNYCWADAKDLDTLPLRPGVKEALKYYQEGMAKRSVVVGRRYRHFKGREYLVLAVARHSESLEELVVYQALYGDHGIWVRPIRMFTEQVLIAGQPHPRFELIE